MKTLIIDRVTVFQQIIVAILDDSAIEHVFASTGQEALEILEREKIDCICLALYLDDMDGFELSKKIRKTDNYKHTPIVLLTTKNSDEIITQAIQAGITDIFSKEKVHELVNFIERFTQINKPISGKILYIEDQKSQRDLVTAMFKSRNLDVDSFDNAEDAWQSFLTHQYQLVVTDIVLAGEISGVLLINKIRRLDGFKGDIPILAITAFDDPSRRISLYHMGLTDYVTKPIIEEELIARVRNLVNNQNALEREIDFRTHLNSEETVRQTLKMEALGKLTGGIAHDYNNMLGVIIGFTELLKHNLSDQPKLLSYVEQIEKAGDNGVQLTSKLLSFTRKDSKSAQVVNINTLISDSQPMLEKLLTAGIRLNISLDDKLWNISIDPSDFENALLNMSINAKHAMGDSGALTINTANKNLTVTTAEKLSLPAGDYVRISILDTGSGMDKDTVAKIFDPFYSTKGEEGTGLGLSQVYGFVERAHGTIKVDSKLGKGTIFSLYFPRTDENLTTIIPKEKNIKVSTSGKGESILVVDDEVALTELLTEILSSNEYQVVSANSAVDAIEACKKNKFDLMITDIIMPNMNGYELSEKIQKRFPDIKIITVSGYNDRINKTGDNYAFINKHLDKPVSSARLLDEVKSLLS